jgi:hypothetical protein
MSAALLFLWLARLPCLPVELGGFAEPEPPVALPGPPPPAPAPPPAPPAPLPPVLAMREVARYRIGYGMFTSVGEARLSIDSEQSQANERSVHAAGYAEGAILGLGRMEKRIDADFDPAALGSRRWTTVRNRGGKTITDIIDQPRPGVMELVRQKEGQVTEKHQASFSLPTFDGLGFLLHLRIAPLETGRTQVLQLLDGLALWRVTLTARGREPLPDSDDKITAVRLDGQADPIFYDGSPDNSDRPKRTFTMWLSDDELKIPLRLEMPVGISDVVVQLVELTRKKR